MSDRSLLLYALIVGCEVAFWLALLASLVTRYLLRRESLSRWFLYALPAIDLLLVAFTAVDLKAGTPATPAHGLAAVYVGFTIAFGSIAVRWADSRFAHRFASGPPPPAAPSGWKAVRFDLVLWLRCIAAWVIAFVILDVLIAWADDPAVTAPLHAWYKHGFGCVVFWFLFGPVWSLVLVRRRER